jgi:serine/threonine protein kinase
MRRGKKCNNVTDYERVAQVGEGQYGQVFQARCRRTGRVVALKKLKVASEKDGFPITSIREINTLRNLKHPNIVDLVEIVTNRQLSSAHRKAAFAASSADGISGSPGDFKDEEDEEDGSKDGSIYMVFEYLEYDLQGLLNAQFTDVNMRVSPVHVKSYMKQFLEGVRYMHTNKILHRDLKAANILVSRTGRLKIADWGLARPENAKLQRYTPTVFTLWFRPPEILMGILKYESSADMWSVGCIFGEMLRRGGPLMAAMKDDDVEQIDKIFSLCGTPKLDSSAPGVAEDPNYRHDLWPGVAEMCPNWHLFAELPPKPRQLQQMFGGNAHVARHGAPVKVTHRDVTVKGLALLERLLTLDPKKRISAADALNHDYFWAEGQPAEPETYVCSDSVSDPHLLDRSPCPNS